MFLIDYKIKGIFLNAFMTIISMILVVWYKLCRSKLNT